MKSTASASPSPPRARWLARGRGPGAGEAGEGGLGVSGTRGGRGTFALTLIKDPRGPTPGGYPQARLPPGSPPVAIVTGRGRGRPAARRRRSSAGAVAANLGRATLPACGSASGWGSRSSISSSQRRRRAVRPRLRAVRQPLHDGRARPFRDPRGNARVRHRASGLGRGRPRAVRPPCHRAHRDERDAHRRAPRPTRPAGRGSSPR